jgi:hypothetical protein
MIVDTPWYVPNTVIQKDLQIYTVKEESAATALNTELASVHTQMTRGATRQQAIAKTPAKWPAYQIPSVIVVFVISVFKV